jgi:site-specific DNA-cytosine methylase
MAGFRELLAVEWEQNAADTFRLNFPHVPLYHGDIAKLSVDECLRLAGVKPGELTVFDGSPPCQGFSTSGKREIGDARNQLFREYCRLLEGLRPRAFVMENSRYLTWASLPELFHGPSAARERAAAGPTPSPEGAIDFHAQKEHFERDFIVRALTRFGGRINQTVAHAGIPKNTLLRKIRKYEINPADYGPVDPEFLEKQA